MGRAPVPAPPAPPAPPPPPPPPAPTGPDRAATLAQLDALLTTGVITREEHDDIAARVLT